VPEAPVIATVSSIRYLDFIWTKRFYKGEVILNLAKRRVIYQRQIAVKPNAAIERIGIMLASNGMDILEGESVMTVIDCTFCKMLLNAVSHAVVAAVLIKVASVYRYVQVFV
jgi:hypothetical protein